MDLIFDNFHFLLFIGLAFAAWLKNRGESVEDEQEQRRVREEMARHFEELEKRTPQRTQPSSKPAPPPVPQQWNTGPQAAEPTTSSEPQSKPPPLREIFREVIESVEPTLASAIPKAEPERDAYDDEPAPWEEFHHMDTSQSEIDDAMDPHESPLLRRQREMQQRLAEIKKETIKFKGKVAGARETQRRLERRGQEDIITIPSIASALKDRKQTRRAIVLNEILSKPLGLRGMS